MLISEVSAAPLADDAIPAPALVGDPSLANRPMPPASTFKIALALIGLETGACDPAARVVCRERHLPGGGGAIALHDALLYSSNLYFIDLARTLGRPRLAAGLACIGYPAPDPASLTWLPDDWRAAPHGGSLRITPLAAHRFMHRLAAGGPWPGQPPPASAAIATVIAALRWPDPTPGVTVHGKTGAWGGAVWFTGFGNDERGRRRIVTVMLPGAMSRRPAAIAAFYRAFGARCEPGWLRTRLSSPAP